MRVRFRFALLAVLIMLLGKAAYSADDGVGIISLTHVGVPVTDLQRALHFYVDQLGMKEAFRLNKADGSPMLIYLHVGNSNTFVELFPGRKAPTSSAPTIYHKLTVHSPSMIRFGEMTEDEVFVS